MLPFDRSPTTLRSSRVCNVAGDATVSPTVILRPSGRVLEAEIGESIFEVLRRHDQPIASSCSGDGICDKCRVRMLAGMENISPMNDVERRFLVERPFQEGERLACQTVIRGDVILTTDYW
jgi:ferredoxin, 2Fe-2S